MKNKLFTLAAALMLAAAIGTIYAAPALAQVVKAVLVKSVDEKGRAPFRQRVSPGSCPTVPADTRLVVEHISGLITAPGPVAGLAVVVGGVRTWLELKSPFTGPAGSTYTIDSPTLIYFNSGATGCDTVSAGGILNTVELTYSGYFVDLPI